MKQIMLYLGNLSLIINTPPNRPKVQQKVVFHKPWGICHLPLFNLYRGTVKEMLHFS